MSAILNKKNEKTEKIIHIMVTSLCGRNCPHCCNKQYDLNSIPYVTDEELRNADTICITGGEPFLFANPPQIVTYYKQKYKNIKNIYVYSNASELSLYLVKHLFESMSAIDGVSVSVKNKLDLSNLKIILSDTRITNMASNRLYVFENLAEEMDLSRIPFEVIQREWQKEFKPANNSIFRRA